MNQHNNSGTNIPYLNFSSTCDVQMQSSSSDPMSLSGVANPSVMYEEPSLEIISEMESYKMDI